MYVVINLTWAGTSTLTDVSTQVPFRWVSILFYRQLRWEEDFYCSEENLLIDSQSFFANSTPDIGFFFNYHLGTDIILRPVSILE